MEDRFTRIKPNEVLCNQCGMEMVDLLASVHVCKNERIRDIDYETVVNRAVQVMLAETQFKIKPKQSSSSTLVIETPSMVEVCEESKSEAQDQLSVSSTLNQTLDYKPKHIKSIRTSKLFREVKLRERKIARLLRNIGKNHEAITYKSFRKLRLIYEY